MAKRTKCWSYNAGEKGRNWVRAYEDGQGGKLYLEWRETAVDPSTGADVTVRRRVCLKGITDKQVAKQKADKLAAEFGTMEAAAAGPVTMARLLTLYLKEVTPKKTANKQRHDRRAAKIFVTFLSGSPEPARHAHRKPHTLDRTDWDRFIIARRQRRIPGHGPVKDRAVEYDLAFLVAVLTWATGAGENGRMYLDQHPWSAEKRRAQKWEMPKEQNPLRPPMTDEVRAKLIEHSPSWRFTLALQLGRETISRNGSVRHLRWSDIDLENKTVRWRSEHDKNGWDIVTPLTDEAVAALRAVPRGIGDAWVFPAPEDPARPCSRATMQTWLRRTKRVAGIVAPGLGFHGEKRAGVRENRDLPPKVLEALARTHYNTLLRVYDGVDLDTLREAMDRKRKPA